MFSTADLIAQKKQSYSFVWTVGGVIPASDANPSIGVAGPVAGIHQKVFIVAGGSNFADGMPWNGGKKKYYNKGYVFKKDKNDVLELFKSFELPADLAYAASCAVSTGILVAGGENTAGLSKKVFIIQWNETENNIGIIKLPDLPDAVTNAAITCVGNIVYLVGGEMENKVSDKLICLDLNKCNLGWKELSPAPKPVSHTIFLAQSSTETDGIYLLGGRKKNNNGLSDLYASVYVYIPVKDAWIEKSPLPYALSAGTGIIFSKNNIFLFGGDKGETFHRTEALIAAIALETDGEKKQLLNQQKIQLQTNHPGFSNKVLCYNSTTGVCKIIGKIPYFTPVTTLACKWDNEVLIPCGEIKAGVRTPQILWGKISNQVKLK